jgi:hypothetical protein
MEASNVAAGLDPDDTIPTWNERYAQAFESTAPGSSTRLTTERPTLPPPATDDVMVSRIHLGPTVDEVLYRLSLGDLAGAALANEELENCIPSLGSAPVVIAAMQLTYLEEFMVASIDGESTWGEILDSSPFSPKETLEALCQLVDKGALSLA